MTIDDLRLTIGLANDEAADTELRLEGERTRELYIDIRGHT